MPRHTHGPTPRKRRFPQTEVDATPRRARRHGAPAVDLDPYEFLIAEREAMTATVPSPVPTSYATPVQTEAAPSLEPLTAPEMEALVTRALGEIVVQAAHLTYAREADASLLDHLRTFPTGRDRARVHLNRVACAKRSAGPGRGFPAREAGRIDRALVIRRVASVAS